MLGGSPTPRQRAQLRENEEQLQEHRRLSAERDRQILRHADSLVQSVGRSAREGREREELATQLAQARQRHQQDLQRQRQRLNTEHEEAARRHAEELEEQSLARLEAHVACFDELEEGAMDEAQREEFSEVRARRSAEIAEAEAEHRQAALAEERAAGRSFEALVVAQAQARQLTEERDSEADAAGVARQALQAQRRAARRREQVLDAEVRAQEAETEELRDQHRGLEARARSLRQELSRATYGVGQRDQELKVKNSELHEVRQSLGGIQSEMDEVNSELKEQCGRVQRVEASMEANRDLGDRVAALRAMLKESHDALGLLCPALEAERTERDQCAQGLKQQRVRTELLLQLLHHFKSRTQDLTPQALLSASSASSGLLPSTLSPQT